MKIVHLGYAHKSNDIRIFLKECCSLRKKGYEVYYITSDKNSDRLGKFLEDEIQVTVLKRTTENKIKRYWHYLKMLEKAALEIDADVYHIHETGLLPIVSKLKKYNKLVVYDSHEDTPRQMEPEIERKYCKLIGKIFEKCLEVYENYVAKKTDYIVAATPYICQRFLKVKKEVICINNYPILNDLKYCEKDKEKDTNGVCFTGGISLSSGIEEIIKALEQTNGVRFLLAGSLEKTLKHYLEQYAGWKKTEYYGVVEHKKVAQICQKSFAGLILYHPLPNHINAQPNKMFEYMLMGLPIICSNFPLWKSMIEEKKCGICVNPLKPGEIAKAINKLYNDTNAVEIMGKNARKAILEEYNWDIEEKKLYKVYDYLEGKIHG